MLNDEIVCKSGKTERYVELLVMTVCAYTKK